MIKASTATKVIGNAMQMFDPREHAKLNGMTEWFMPKEIDEMQMRINQAYLDTLKWRGSVPRNG